MLCKSRSMPCLLKQKIYQELYDSEKWGVITLVNSSEWTALLVAMLKEGGKIRLSSDH